MRNWWQALLETIGMMRAAVKHGRAAGRKGRDYRVIPMDPRPQRTPEAVMSSRAMAEAKRERRRQRNLRNLERERLAHVRMELRDKEMIEERRVRP